MDQNEPHKYATPAKFVAVFAGAVALAATQLIVEDRVTGYFIGGLLGLLLGIGVYWLTPMKRPLTPEQSSFWAMITMMGSMLVFALAALLRGEMGSALFVICLGGFNCFFFYISWKQHRKLLRE